MGGEFLGFAAGAFRIPRPQIPAFPRVGFHAVFLIIAVGTVIMQFDGQVFRILMSFGCGVAEGDAFSKDRSEAVSGCAPSTHASMAPLTCASPNLASFHTLASYCSAVPSDAPVASAPSTILKCTVARSPSSSPLAFLPYCVGVLSNGIYVAPSMSSPFHTFTPDAFSPTPETERKLTVTLVFAAWLRV